MAELLELFQRAVPDRQGASLLATVVERDRKAENIAEAYLKRRGVGVLAAPGRRFLADLRPDLALRNAFDIAYGEALVHNPARNKLRVRHGEQCTTMSRGEIAAARHDFTGSGRRDSRNVLAIWLRLFPMTFARSVSLRTVIRFSYPRASSRGLRSARWMFSMIASSSPCLRSLQTITIGTS